MKIEIDDQLVRIRKGEELLVLPLALFPREFIAFVDKPQLTPSQKAQLDQQCMDCG
jgi:hypothetical protein